MVVTPEPEPEETEGPDLAITSVTATPTSVQPGDRTTLRATIVNVGAPEETKVIRFYRHTALTENPKTGGRYIGSRTTTLPTDESRTVSGRTRTPTTPGTYYYYACVNAVQGEQDTQNNCSQTPATVTVQQETEVPPVEEPEETPEPTTKPDLTVTDTVSLPLATTQSGDTVTIQAKITNIGDGTAEASRVRVYRHTTKTNNPRQGGARETNTATTSSLSPTAAVSITSTHQAPTVSATTRYYYYVCVDTVSNEQDTANNCSPTPAEVAVRVKPEDPGPPYRDCYELPGRSTPMGGDGLLALPVGFDDPTTCGTITLGGLETTTGERGFVVSGHVIAGATLNDEGTQRIYNFTNTNVLTTHNYNWSTGDFTHFLGKVFRTSTFTFDRTNLDWKVFAADAAFVAYPHPKTPGCPRTWSGDGEDLCLTPGHSDTYLDRVVPLAVRGANGTTHTVVGSREPTDNLAVQAFGSVTGTPKKAVVTDGKSFGSIGDAHYFSYTAIGGSLIGGDSGAPVYTIPNSAGTVNIVGIAKSIAFINGKPAGFHFSSWDDVTQGLDLKPISAPAPGGPSSGSASVSSIAW